MTAKISIFTYCSFGAKLSHSELGILRVFFLTINKKFPDAEIFLYTDTQGMQWLAGSENIKIKEIKRTNVPLILNRSFCVCEFLRERETGEIILLLDYDIIINRKFNLDIIPEGISYTIRPAKVNPINGGVLIIKNHSQAITHQFDQILEIYQSLPYEDLEWWGDQKALYLFFEKRSYSELFSLKNLIKNTVQSSFIDSNVYNWTPFDFDLSLATYKKYLFYNRVNFISFSEKDIVHFKGPRKHLMIHYNHHLNSTIPRIRIGELETITDVILQERYMHLSKILSTSNIHDRQSSLDFWGKCDELLFCLLFGQKKFGQSFLYATLRATPSLIDCINELKSHDYRFNLIDPQFKPALRRM